MSLIGLLGAEAISLTGSRMSLIALPWLVLVTSGSPTLTGAAAAIEMVPYVAAGALGAPIVDRLGARRVSIAADALSAVVVGALPFAYRTGFGALAVLVALAGALRGVGDISKRVLLPAAVERSGMAMMRATSVYDGISRGSALAGGLAAGVLVAWLGAPAVILIDAASFVVCAVLVGALVRTGAAADREHPKYLGALREGVRHAWRDPLVVSIVAMMFAINLFDTAALSVYIPVWARDVAGSPVAIGICSAAFALGAAAGNLVVIAFTERLPRYLTFSVGFLLACGPRFLTLGLSSSIALVACVMFAAGIGVSAANPVIATVMYERVPERLQARVFGVATAVAFAGMPLGSLLGGVAVQASGLRIALLATAGLCFAATLFPLIAHRTWRQLDG